MTYSKIRNNCPTCNERVKKEERIVHREGPNSFHYYCPNCHPKLKEQFKNPIETSKKALLQLKEDSNPSGMDYGYLGWKQKFRY